MSIKPTVIKRAWDRWQRSHRQVAIGAVLLLLVSIGLLYLILTGRLRGYQSPVVVASTEGTTTTIPFVPRRLDGMLVPTGEEAFAPRAVMIENHPDARPLSGLSKAQVVIEAPVEGGITRFMAFFDATTTVAEVGPVRSARPYFVEWAKAWNAVYFHVGGSPDALDLIKSYGLAYFTNVNEMRAGQYFWHDGTRFMPHNTYTSHEVMSRAAEDALEMRKLVQSNLTLDVSTMPIAWHFQDAATTSNRGDVLTVRVPYGGNYNVTWKFDREAGTYKRFQSGVLQIERDGATVETENIVVMRTDEKVLDAVGRLQIRTIGSGDALLYRDGNKYTMRWRRSPGEPIKFVGIDGAEFLLTRGRTWIEVTTDDRVFAGLTVTTPTTK